MTEDFFYTETSEAEFYLHSPYPETDTLLLTVRGNKDSEMSVEAAIALRDWLLAQFPLTKEESSEE